MAGERARLGSGAPTLADVAELAGVSQVTVSRIIRGKGPVAAETRTRVMQAVTTVGYVPNRLAGSLASAGSNLIGVILPSLSNIVFPEVLRGINEGLDVCGFQPVVAVTDYDMQREETLVRAILAWKPAAIVIAGFDHTAATRKMLEESGIRVAELMDIDAAPIDVAVGLSHRKAGHASGLHLIGRGYRRFGYVGHDWDADRRAKLRYEGLCEALSDAGLALVGRSLDEGRSSVMAGRLGLADLLSKSPSVDVVVFSSDDMAVGGVFHCMAAGIALKSELGLFGFNGLEIGQALPVPLSTIRSDRYRIGRVAVERILESASRPARRQIVDLGFEIVVGGSA